MNIQELSSLSTEEAKLVLHAPAIITAMIATADGNVDDAEIEWAEKVVEYRTHIGDEALYDYYELVESEFEAYVAHVLAQAEEGNQSRIAHLEAELAKLSAILPKLNQTYAKSLLKSWKSLATQVAKASGGFLGFGSISQQEEQLISLDMIKF